MTSLSVLLPTVAGRERSLDRAVRSYTDEQPAEVIVIRDRPSCAVAWNEAMEQASGDVLLFAADDLEALPGWLHAGLLTLNRGMIPAPRIWNHDRTARERGEQHWNAADGADGAVTSFSRIPLLTRAMWEKVGQIPEIHYFSDCWISDKAAAKGIQTVNCYGYDFVHHWEQPGRHHDDRADFETYQRVKP